MSPEDRVDPTLGVGRSRGEDAPLNCGDLDTSPEERDWAKARSSHHPRRGESHFLQMLMDAESAANAAAAQLISFKDALDSESAASRQTSHKSRITQQRRLLLEKLEDFRQINKSVRQTLKQLQQAEAEQVHADKQVHSLLTRISMAENENEMLKKDLCEMGKRVEELKDQKKEEQDYTKSAVHLTKSVEATRAHLQGQLRSKEAENNRLTVQLRTLERTVTQQRLEMEDLKASFTALREKAAQDKEALKKATRAQKHRAERSEAAVEKCYAQLKEKDAELTNARLQRDSKKRQKELITDEKDKLISQITFLKSQIVELNARLLKERDDLSTANESMMQQVQRLTAENGDLSFNNSTLKASVAQLEAQLADCEAALVEEKIVSQEKNHKAKQLHRQVEDLQAEISKTRMIHASVLKQKENIQDGREAEVQKMESQRKQLSSFEEMKESIHEANSQLQEKVHSLQMAMDSLQQENSELIRRLGRQEEAVGFSNRQLDQRSSECHALSRQLDSALSDIKQQVNKVKNQAAAREEALQTKILELEAQICRRDKELSVLRQSKITAAKQFEVRLKDLQCTLDQSESHKQSIQNYVDFLKNSYTTMFDEGLQATCFTSSYFLK
ncbi:outer dense fiber protein 2-like isoform X1 [Periophthalmus magnuspinnatus]|uniref:outer dense fiber protein 2-like isoform X1 n=1 Tax=Periophthalmus magnuspinnatus TaxID=409849 RepID=UPI002436FF20|nr:outer dense fiber protein 2-like isoform X1 [Periophthalmus magnuspinnatus]XP_055084391.1 outer dense fiber protein 2-like isoform X1 [Periophthalmus magnuspinnatus]XP_055084392.1 outer dense fiber protein 2-like isoform X1 [Periophthalmus magnuspinnatus]